ncbi:putative glucuronate isomerase [Planococcus sp. PAMC 21323]|uniref:glucuronate isomerase n=1 Tax=Planococcus sp. PAMC 21323 TaxID=1526927 RepID=UPI0005714597|nr:glucuronate isomerase [Planococcus sp. PAMC 21323]AIY05683.1 putative glucuronate isomerase [Planococcus sp. PAMC 21323]
MKFLTEDFLLNTESAKILYHQHAKDMPLYDFHCHLSPQQIAEDHRFENITEVWLKGDHYKWRAMRAFGIDEKLITGNAGDKEKFHAWIRTVPYTMGNPLYHWSHLELKKYFGYDDAIKEENWEELWEKLNQIVQSDNFSARKLIQSSNVKVICTTDDPADSLEYHIQIAEDETIETKVLPTFRPDKGLGISAADFLDYVRKMEVCVGFEIKEYKSFLKALENRVDFFHKNGCRISDHGFEYLPYAETTMEEASNIFLKALKGEVISKSEEEKYKTFTMQFLGELYAKNDWVMQLHVGPLRNNNDRMFEKNGPDAGFDSINDFELARPLNQFLNSLDAKQVLPRTIIYPLNPVHFEMVASTIGNFQSGGIKGKVQFGSGWWFNDTKEGMIRQMKELANAGLLSLFVGMLTDSRSFLSYTRHDYFRRILCQLVGSWIEEGELPADYEFIGQLIQDICYNNAKEYFAIELD